jgi:hypothetical protein
VSALELVGDRVGPECPRHGVPTFVAVQRLSSIIIIITIIIHANLGSKIIAVLKMSQDDIHGP